MTEVYALLKTTSWQLVRNKNIAIVPLSVEGKISTKPADIGWDLLDGEKGG